MDLSYRTELKKGSGFLVCIEDMSRQTGKWEYAHTERVCVNSKTTQWSHDTRLNESTNRRGADVIAHVSISVTTTATNNASNIKKRK